MRQEELKNSLTQRPGNRYTARIGLLLCVRSSAMLNLLGRSFDCCDGISRRSLLRVGALSLGGLSLPNVLAQRAEAARSGAPAKQTSVIFIELAGGPTHFETYDPKPLAPAEYRGPLGTVATSVS